jgi:hypothetical protein
MYATRYYPGHFSSGTAYMVRQGATIPLRPSFIAIVRGTKA